MSSASDRPARRLDSPLYLLFDAKKFKGRAMTWRNVRICEVGPRDGLQLVRHVMPTAEKLRWLGALAACGFPEIDAASFVPPQAFPQFADAPAIVAAARASRAR